MPTSLLRLVVLCAVLAGLAAATPTVAPNLMASLFRGETASPAPVAQKPRNRVSSDSFAINADPRGHFLVEATVDGRSIQAVVDTGATTVALTARTAHHLGIRLSAADYSARISTANGVVSAAPVVLSEVSLGNITVRDVTAMVVPGNALEVNLLGMSFLNRLARFESSGGRMVLTE